MKVGQLTSTTAVKSLQYIRDSLLDLVLGVLFVAHCTYDLLTSGQTFSRIVTLTRNVFEDSHTAESHSFNSNIIITRNSSGDEIARRHDYSPVCMTTPFLRG